MLLNSKHIKSLTVEPSCYKILVVDDEEQIRKLIQTLLSGKGYQCATANDGLEALEKIKENKFDAVITDILMPEMDGIALTKELSNCYQNLPIMVITGHTKDYSPKDAILAGAREFISKPFSSTEFLVRFEKMLSDHKEQEALLALSLIDELTGLYNRRRFFILAEQYMKLSIRSNMKLLLFFIDIDDLKWINDNYGHQAGDLALIGFANILKKTFRESDIIARIGGDEFVVLSESPEENSEAVTARLHEKIKDYNEKSSLRYQLSVSVGVSKFHPQCPISIDELLSQADVDMYATKRKKGKRDFFQPRSQN